MRVRRGSGRVDTRVGLNHIAKKLVEKETCFAENLKQHVDNMIQCSKERDAFSCRLRMLPVAAPSARPPQVAEFADRFKVEESRPTSAMM